MKGEWPFHAAVDYVYNFLFRQRPVKTVIWYDLHFCNTLIDLIKRDRCRTKRYCGLYTVDYIHLWPAELPKFWKFCGRFWKIAKIGFQS